MRNMCTNEQLQRHKFYFAAVTIVSRLEGNLSERSYHRLDV